MISWAVETLIASSLLMLVVLAVRGLVARHFGPHIAYGLWLLPALRMLLPPLPEQVTPAPLRILPSTVDIEALLMAPVPVATPAEPLVDWPLLMAVFWGGGALLFLVWHILSYRRFVGAALDEATQLPRYDRDGVEVCASPVARGPFAAGIFLKTVVLPEDYRRRYERDELRLAIEHEIQHHRRCDMSANFAALVVLALHWWNPIAHFAHRAFRVDQELACDALVLAAATPAERHAYGSALLKSACDRLPVAACALGAGDDLKRRLTMMKTYRWSATRARIGSVIAAGLVGGGLLLTASNGIAAETTKQVEEQVRTALAPIVPAVAPAPVAAPMMLAASTDRAPHPVVRVERQVKRDGRVVTIVTEDLRGAERAAIMRERAQALREAQQARLEAHQAQMEARQAQIEARADADEAQREAMDAAREAQLEAAQAGREAAAEARAEALEAAAEARADAQRVRIAARTCSNGQVAATVDGRRAVVRCGHVPAIDSRAVRKQMIASLEQARRSVSASMDEDWARRTREQALASIDREIARLKATK